MHPYIHIGSLSLPSMGVCILCGTVVALLVLFFYARRLSVLSTDEITDGLIWAILLGFVGMKLLYWIVEPPAWPTTWLEVYKLLSEGMVFYGGLIGGILGVFIVSRIKKRSFFTYADLFAPCFCLAHAGGRVGCLLAGCCYGMECQGGLCVTINGVSRFPSQPAESLFLILLAVALLMILKRTKHRGTVTGVYLMCYAVARFILEFFRGDAERGFVGNLSTSQFIGFFIFAAGLVIFLLSRRWPKDDPKAIAAIPADKVDPAPTVTAEETPKETKDEEDEKPAAAPEITTPPAQEETKEAVQPEESQPAPEMGADTDADA